MLGQNPRNAKRGTSMQERLRIISKEGRRWKVVHSDGAVTYHKTKKAAQEYRHTITLDWDVYALDPFSERQDECA